MSEIDPTGDATFYQANQNSGRDITIPRFYMRPCKNEFRSAQEGHPIFEDKEYVEIIIPGNRGTTVDTPVRQEHRERWAQQYAAFKANQQIPESGTPIEEWAAVTRSQVEEFKYYNVRTVETLAALDDGALAKVCPMGGFALRERAKRFLEQAKGSAPADALAAKLEEQSATMALMEEQNKALLARLEKLETGASEAKP